MGKLPKKKSSNVKEDLHTAARSGDLSAVQSMCCYKPLAINSTDNYSRTPLHLAAWAGHAEVVDYLCKNKADVGAAALDNMAAIHFASSKGHFEVVQILLSFGASIKASNRKGMTPLHFAVQGSHVEIVKLLVTKGASLSAKAKDGKTPIDLATSDEVYSFLVESGWSSDRGDLNGKQKGQKAHTKLFLHGKAEGSDGEEEENEKSFKRNGNENDIKENSRKPKKAKVALKS